MKLKLEAKTTIKDSRVQKFGIQESLHFHLETGVAVSAENFDMKGNIDSFSKYSLY